MLSRSKKRWLWRMLIAVALVGLAAFGVHWSKKVEFQRRAEAYQRKADATEWRWSNERTQLDYCVKHNLRGYTARITQHGWGECEIAILDGAQEVCAFEGHDKTVFVQIDDVIGGRV